MNDNDVLDALRGSIGETHMRTPAREIVAAGHARRRLRFAGKAVAGAALATGLAVALGLGDSQLNAPPVTAAGQVHVRLAAFSVDTNANGTVTVQLTKMESLDPEIMQRTLAQAGVPAQITINKWCRPTDPEQELTRDFEKVVGEEKRSDATAVMVITPSAMPPGTKLTIGMRTADYQPESPSPVAVWMRLVPDDAPLTCSTDVPIRPSRESGPVPAPEGE